MTLYRIAPAAKRDLSSIRGYLTEFASAEVAASVLRELRDAMELLGRNPGIGHRRPDLTTRNVLFWVVYTYYTVYREERRPIEVARVLSTHRDVKRSLG
ncbi:MAG: type II toxin-antitoxin system RelE/ParE family toxin [Candidatus Methylomirabilis sp.]|nr:type II toxin-antitoxin system RelE/ParE family toxin [Deltaproteobacteria bacterium]